MVVVLLWKGLVRFDEYLFMSKCFLGRKCCWKQCFVWVICWFFLVSLMQLFWIMMVLDVSCLVRCMLIRWCLFMYFWVNILVKCLCWMLLLCCWIFFRMQNDREWLIMVGMEMVRQQFVSSQIIISCSFLKLFSGWKQFRVNISVLVISVVMMLLVMVV